MNSYTGYRIVALLPVIAVIVGIVLFFSPVGRHKAILDWFWVAQVVTLLAGTATYILAVRRGMPHSMLIMLSLCVATMCITAIGLSLIFLVGNFFRET
ncbi:MAG: hypothetical protein JWQ98_1277 [Chlorobi bacterium]|nr:hypothetical protein [Chlorobiota bacterium]